MALVTSLCAQVLLLATLLQGCARPPAQTRAQPARAPVIVPRDSSWARLSRPCPNDAPVRFAPVRPELPPGLVRTRDDHAAELARRVPGGYGGLFVEYDPPLQPDGAIRYETRRPVVFLVDTTQREAALRALASGTQSDQPALHVVGARIRSARWSFAELYDWYGLLLNIVSREGIVTTGIDKKHNRILFGVHDAAARYRLERDLARLDLPCFLVGIHVVGPRVPG
jgi:hypothetical protein